MDYDLIIENHKKRTAIVNDYLIDAEYLKKCLSQILSENAQSSPEFDKLCISLCTLCDRISTKVLELKEVIPGKNEVIETKEVS